MLPDQQRLTAQERGNLVAYLDGELPDPETRALATKLTQSTSARREVDALERTWELLDYLPRPQASGALTERTLSMARSLDERGDLAYDTAGNLARRAVQVAAVLGVAALLGAAGYALSRFAVPDPTARLARDLSIAEHLDEYRAIGTLDYLRRLDAIFTEGQ